MILQHGVVAAAMVLALATPALAAPLVLFDQGHNQQFLIEKDGELDLSKLAGVMTTAGLETKAVTGPLSTAALTGARGLVISGAFAPLAPEETAAVKRFVEEGGRLVVLLHIGPPLAGLLGEFGVVHSNGAIRESEQIIGDEPLNFAANVIKLHPVMNGLQRFNVYGAWALANDTPLSEAIAGSGAHAWVDLNGDKKLGSEDAVQAFGVAVAGQLGRGEFVIFGDDAIFQNRFLKDENEVLAQNLAHWFME